MSTLPVRPSLSTFEVTSPVVRRPSTPGPPMGARGGGGAITRSERSVFVIDGRPVGSTGVPPVMVIAVKVSGAVAGRFDVRAPAEVSRFAEMVPPLLIGDPYAQAGEPDRGTLVDAYV